MVSRSDGPPNNPRGAVPFTKGPFRRFVSSVSLNAAWLRLTQQGVEVINSGAPASQDVRLTQQGVEAINSGNPASQFVRLTQQGVEVIVSFGTPPVQGSGKKNNGKGTGSGGGKKIERVSMSAFRARIRVARQNTTMRFISQQPVYTPDPYMLSLAGANSQQPPFRTVETVRTIFR